MKIFGGSVQRVVLVVLGAGLFITGAWHLGQGLYILGKAELAQVLIEAAWDKNLQAGRQQNKPWRWADTTPVARLEFARQGASMVVLSGDSGRILAFGPGHSPDSPLPATGGNSVLSGHRDTHFSVLKSVAHDDLIHVQTLQGITASYRVNNIRVVDKSAVGVKADNGIDELTLVTCWPFDALDAGGPARLVISAQRIGEPPETSSATPAGWRPDPVS